MDEAKKEVAEETPKPKSEDTGKGVQPETISELDRADQIAERQKRENDRREEILTREENLAARKAVGGVTEAGQSAPVKKEETDKEYRVRVEKELASGKTEFGD